MILTIDIGNTNIAFGFFEHDALVFVAHVATNALLTEDEYAAKLYQTLTLHGEKVSSVEGAIISSVVPPLNSVMKKAVGFLFGVEPIIVGPGIKTGISIHCDMPSSVGSDLICACVAVHSIYGSPSLIVDMGTATKMMVLRTGGTFIGVSIIPGVYMGMEALAAGTAQLPQVSLETPSDVIGKNTPDSMRSGVIYGNAALVDGMIDRINEEMGESLPVYVTGGAATLITPYCRHEMKLDSGLVLKGLYILYEKNS